MSSVMDPVRKNKVDDSGLLRTPDRLSEFCDLHVQLSEVWKTMIGTCGPYDSGGSATHRNGRPKMIGDFSSRPVSTTTKSTGTYDCPTLMIASSRTPSG
jgi:hypothetical protein